MGVYKWIVGLLLASAWSLGGLGFGGLSGAGEQAIAQEPIQVGFLWHMHQPTYFPGESVTQTDAAGHYSFSIADVHNQRLGPYTSWPKDAIQAGQNLANLGAQVSFSGSLIQNLNNLESAGINGGQWNGWKNSYNQAQALQTSEGNTRLDLVNFGFNHPLMPLLDERDIRMQIRAQKHIHQQTWGTDVPFSKGIFPPETAFSERIIPALVAEGIEWSIVDNIHFDRATKNYPHTNSSNLYAPNRADQINPDPTANGGAWVQLNNLWAPGQVSAPFSYQPHKVQHVNPSTGAISSLVAVPGARYEGNEDGRGGFGALQYEQVMDQYRQYNTDPNHPMFVVLHHDGDNFGGGSESYYHGNFQSMVNWAANTPNYNVSTIQDYLDRFPVAQNDVIHVESGSWAGADNGDSEFKKWLGDPDPSGWSPDRNSWAVLTAAKNRVFTAEDISPVNNVGNVVNGTGSQSERAWHFLLQAEASDYWYWDGTEVWDSNVTQGSNLAVAQADQVINSYSGQESTPPSVFIPQRESYNPGGFEWATNTEPSDFEVWTYAYDVSGLSDVTLKWRVDSDGENPLASTQNETYAGGAEVGAWSSLAMTSSDVAPPAYVTNPTYRALRYGGMITGFEDVLLDYYVEAVDANGNITRSDIQHVYVGSSNTGGGSTAVFLSPDPVQAGQSVTLTYDPAGGPLSGASAVYLHYGFDDWQTTVAVDPLMNWDPVEGLWDFTLPVDASANQLDIVFNNGAGIWDNNNGQDWHFDVEGGDPPPFVMDGQLDAVAQEAASEDGRHIYWSLEGGKLYVATEDAGEGNDVFIYLAESPGGLTAANWGKAGQVAGWDAFLADENDNGFTGWFDATGEAATAANGGVLEGVIDLVALLGAVPSEIYLAVGVFGTSDGAVLLSSLQVPTSTNADGNLDALEYIAIQLLTALDGDYDGNGIVDGADYTVWLDAFGQTGAGLAADGNGDQVVNQLDYAYWKSRFGNTQGSNSANAQVPEPSAVLLALFAGVIGTGIRRTIR